jgi:hypothetical protein
MFDVSKRRNFGGKKFLEKTKMANKIVLFLVQPPLELFEKLFFHKIALISSKYLGKYKRKIEKICETFRVVLKNLNFIRHFVSIHNF